MRVNIEVTDTFGGEANYSWANRQTITLPERASHLSIVRAAKMMMGWTGWKCRTNDFGDMIKLRPSGLCEVMFITFPDCVEAEYKPEGGK
jgi:hypothetical protein